MRYSETITRFAIIVWDGLVRFADQPGHWWLPLAGAVLVLVGIFWLVSQGLDRLEDWRAARDEQVQAAFRRAQRDTDDGVKARRKYLDTAVQIGRRH